MTFTFIYSLADAKQRYYLALSDLIDILNSLYQFASVSVVFSVTLEEHQ